LAFISPLTATIALTTPLGQGIFFDLTRISHQRPAVDSADFEIFKHRVYSVGVYAYLRLKNILNILTVCTPRALEVYAYLLRGACECFSARIAFPHHLPTFRDDLDEKCGLSGAVGELEI
jgi:hypothetical protein